MQLFNSEISDYDEIMKYYNNEYCEKPFDYNHFELTINGKINEPTMFQADKVVDPQDKKFEQMQLLDGAFGKDAGGNKQS
jgi:hypothetical protein